jgi:hypothetical protein
VPGSFDVFFRLRVPVRSILAINVGGEGPWWVGIVETCGGTTACPPEVCSYDQWAATVLDAGEHILVIEGFTPGEATRPIRIEAMPVEGDAIALARGHATHRGRVEGECGGGARDAYWFVECAGWATGEIVATTCVDGGTDTTLEAHVPAEWAAPICERGDLTTCGGAATLRADPPERRLTVLYVGSDDGSPVDYTLDVTVP